LTEGQTYSEPEWIMENRWEINVTCC